jgi:molybdopterin converting factor subunit 1
MIVNVRLFAVVRQLAGAENISLDLPGAVSVADVRRNLIERLPQLAQFGSQLRFAVNAEYADDATPVPAKAEVACIPPVSGG